MYSDNVFWKSESGAYNKNHQKIKENGTVVSCTVFNLVWLGWEWYLSSKNVFVRMQFEGHSPRWRVLSKFSLQPWVFRITTPYFLFLNCIFSFFCLLASFLFWKLAPELLSFGKIKQKEINVMVQSCKVYLSFIQHISLSCPDYHQEIDSKNSADRRKNHIIPCFSKSGEFYKHFVEIDRIWSNDKASPKSCEMIASALKYLVVCVISNLNKNKPRIWKRVYVVKLILYRIFHY